MHLFFPTPIWITKINNSESINTELKDYIYKEKEKYPEGAKKSNVSGWHSDDFDLKSESLKNFIKEISQNIESAIKDMGWDLEIQIVKITRYYLVNK